MRQVMPHRNNIHLRRTKCKVFVSAARGLAASATFLPQGRRAFFSAGEK